jgi:hypothetical protein
MKDDLDVDEVRLVESSKQGHPNRLENDSDGWVYGTYGRVKVVLSSWSRLRFIQLAAKEPVGSEKLGI